MLHLLAAELPSVGRHNGDIACRQAREPREKIGVSIVIDWHSPGAYLLIYIGDWFIPYTAV